jgi:hypothetical protein
VGSRDNSHVLEKRQNFCPSRESNNYSLAVQSEAQLLHRQSYPGSTGGIIQKIKRCMGCGVHTETMRMGSKFQRDDMEANRDCEVQIFASAPFSQTRLSVKGHLTL